ncbi:MAG: RibD family protein [Oscillatoriaceae cyanobacterium Prado104]|jgi:5-amino-6-(5-phosphoribosylamino)uracil reductase|nr:RibD family protein [Oscillatoriaceae cyanobacterium Prado104]
MRDRIPRPHATVILAIAADGKIADTARSPARFGSANDKAHLEQQIAAADAVLFGNGTLRAYGTTLRVTAPDLLDWREERGKPLQPVQIVCSQSCQFDPNWRFFQQPVPRWLLTGKSAEFPSQSPTNLPLNSMFDRILFVETAGGEIDWIDAFGQLANLGIQRLAILGGGQLVASLLAAGSIDEFWLTVCPLILGGAAAPTPVEGKGFLASFAPKLELLAVKQVGQEVFLHYRVARSTIHQGIGSEVNYPH